MNDSNLSAEFYCIGDYAPETSIAYMMRQVLMAVTHEIERQLEPSDLTNAQWVPLFKLFIGKASTVAELARVCHLDAGAMTRLLDRLEAKGLCRRVRSVDDRRVVNIELTQEGRQAAAGIPALLCRVQNLQLAGFTDAEFQTLKGLLRRILDNAQSQSPIPLTSGAPNEA
jgi:DNA-binding MarR family transcriptional regulator